MPDPSQHPPNPAGPTDATAEQSLAHHHSLGQSASRQLIVFDVNDTRSDMSGMAAHFADVGAPPALAGTGFASLLRDGFALTVDRRPRQCDFADLAHTSLMAALKSCGLEDVDDAVDQIMSAFAALFAHPDVVDCIQALAATGARLVTLSNGSTAVAKGLLNRIGVARHFERLLSVQDAPAWKPAAGAYQYAPRRRRCRRRRRDAGCRTPWDIHGARQAGLTTARINRDNATYPTYFDQPDIEVTSLTDLAERLNAPQVPPRRYPSTDWMPKVTARFTVNSGPLTTLTGVGRAARRPRP